MLYNMYILPLWLCFICGLAFSGEPDFFVSPESILIGTKHQISPSFIFEDSSGCDNAVVVKRSDADDLRHKLETLPSGCLLTLSGVYKIDFPLYVNHHLTATAMSENTGEWFKPLVFVKQNNLTDQLLPDPVSPCSNSFHIFYAGQLSQPPAAIISPLPNYPYDAIVFLGERASLENIGIDNAVLPLTEDDCRQTGLIASGYGNIALHQISLSTLLGFCYSRQAGQTGSQQQTGSGSQNSGSTTAQTKSAPYLSTNRQKPSSSISGSDRGRDDDEDKYGDWRRRRILMKAHYFDVDNFNGDWEVYSRFLQNCTTPQKLYTFAEDQMARTRTYQKTGVVMAVTGATIFGALMSGRKARGSWINLPWDHYSYIVDGRLRTSILSSWIYLLGLPFGFMSQLWNFSLISIPKRQHMKELKQKALNDFEKSDSSPDTARPDT